MLKKRLVMCIGLALLLMWGLAFAGTFEVGQSYHGFTLVEKRFVKEVNAECLRFTHPQSGAQLVKIMADDENKTFGIAFKTVPESDAGTPHILEHSVLNGSKNFPVKSPFDVLSKGSLKTFMNAFTGKDVTFYPVASMNDKDYFNLMHVYLDAVFNPLIYTDPRILQQEGWHHELTGRDNPVEYKGVVYNEMKGAFSDPTQELYYQSNRLLFPDNGYAFSAGGYPTAVPTLTYEAFLDFHRRYYHPSNSHITLYGNADLDQELAFIDTEYLSKYENTGVKVDIPLQKPFEKIQDITGYYPVPEGSGTEGQTYLSMNVVVGLNTDRALYMALDALCDILVNHEAGPIRLALQEAGIGMDVSASVDDMQQNVFQIVVQNANPAEAQRFKEIVFKTLQESVAAGSDKDMVQGIINRLEFNLREGNDAQKGFSYMVQMLPGWFFADDPFMTLEYEKPLTQLKTALTGDYLEAVVREYLLDNPHTLFLTLEPKPGLGQEINTRIADELAEYKKTLSDDELAALVTKTEELIAYQQREDSPEALATIPMLERSDINPKAEWYGLKAQKTGGVPLLEYETFTNNVVYVKLQFDTRVLPQELLPYAALLAEVLGSLNTGNYSYGDLDNALNIHTGGFYVGFNVYTRYGDDKQLIPKFSISSKAMNDKVGQLFGLVAEIVNTSKYADAERLKSVLTRHASQVEAAVKQNGYGYAYTRMTSYFSNDGMFDELTGGIDYYRFINDLSKNFDEKADEISAKLTQTAALLFAKGNLTAAVTCQGADLPEFRKGLKSFVESLPKGGAEFAQWNLNPEKKNEGLLTASKVQYVMQGYDYKRLGYQWTGKMHVLGQILTSDYLQTQIRVIGGAYGGFSGFVPNGKVYFSSYRDPNLIETFANYRAVPEYLHNFEADDKTMTRYIIGTISGLDTPLTPTQKGNLALQYYYEKTSPEMLQAERDAVLATTPQDIRAMEKMVQDILDQNAYCVYGNEEKIKAAADVFKTVVPLVQ